jgi:hypothetical protein
MGDESQKSKVKSRRSLKTRNPKRKTVESLNRRTCLRLPEPETRNPEPETLQIFKLILKPETSIL